MIEPDPKDWTWVLLRPCPECNFDVSTRAGTDVALFVRENRLAWDRLYKEKAIKPGRPDDVTWSALEYACHVRDVYRRFLERIVLMLTDHNPLFESWNQNATAIEDAYEEQDPEQVVTELGIAADEIVLGLDQISRPEWQRPGCRSNGSTFTVDSLARYMLHDTVHHVWDVEKQRARSIP